MKTTNKTLTKTVLGGSSVLLALTLGATQASAFSLSDIPVIGGAFDNKKEISVDAMTNTSANVNESNSPDETDGFTGAESSLNTSANVDLNLGNNNGSSSIDGDSNIDADLNFGSMLDEEETASTSTDEGNWFTAKISAWFDTVVELFTDNDSDTNTAR